MWRLGLYGVYLGARYATAGSFGPIQPQAPLWHCCRLLFVVTPVRLKDEFLVPFRQAADVQLCVVSQYYSSRHTPVFRIGLKQST